MTELRKTNFLLEVSKGNITDENTISFVGSNPSVNQSFETCWDVGGVFVFPTVGETWEVVSDNANDDGSPAGTGAQTVLVIGLDTSYNTQSETVTLNGTTPVPTVRTDWFRPRLAIVTLSGSTRSNVGTITLRVSGGGAVRSTILPTNGQSFNGFFTIPAGFTGFLLRTLPIIPKNEDVTIRNKVTLFGSNTDISAGDAQIYQNAVSSPTLSYPSLAEKTDIHLLAKSTNTQVFLSVSVELLLLNKVIAQDLNEIMML